MNISDMRSWAPRWVVHRRTSAGSETCERHRECRAHIAQHRNDLPVALAEGLLRNPHPVEHEIPRFRHAIERRQAGSLRPKRALLAQVEQSILRTLDLQRSLQLRNSLLVVPGPASALPTPRSGARTCSLSGSPLRSATRSASA